MVKATYWIGGGIAAAAITGVVLMNSVPAPPVPQVVVSCTVPSGCFIRFYHSYTLSVPVTLWEPVADSDNGCWTNNATAPAEFFAAVAISRKTLIRSDYASK